MKVKRPPRGSGVMNGPKIPKHLMRDFFRVTTKKDFKQEQGGIYIPISKEEVVLKATLLPINNEDLQYIPEGTSAINSQKLYTNGEVVSIGEKIRDSVDDQAYTVTTELTHNLIHGLKRYIVTKAGVTKT